MAASGKLKFGPYEVLRNPDDSPCILGEGSFGTTYKARHEILGRVTALKVIREELLNRGHKSDHEESSRFLDEARAAGRLGHPGIAMVYDCALDKGVFYYAMEFCDGGTLQDWCATNGPMPWSEVRRVALQIASALDYAHENGFLHRDIKPANIMLNGSGKGRQAKLIDFGLAKKFASDNDSSSATVRNEQDNFRGNFATASPEQVLEKPLDPRSDLFSLGVTLWWLLIGKNPFENMRRGPLIADRVSPTPYADSLPADLAPEARLLLGALLEKDVSKRLPSAHAVLEMLASPSEKPEEPAPAEATATERLIPLATPPELEDGYQLEGVMASLSQVKLYHASESATRRPVVVVTPSGDSLDPDTLGRLRVAASRRVDFGAYAMLDWRISGECDAFVVSKPEGCSLLSILRKFGPARFADALPLLARLARCFDASQAWTTFGIRVDPGEIFLSARDGGVDLGQFRAWPDVDPLAARCLPLFSADADHSATTEATLSTSAQEFPPLAQFAAFVYRVVAGSSVRYAAFFTTSGYVMASGLSEDGNALLSETICAPESQPSACRFLQLLASLESQPLGELRPLVEPPSASDLAVGRLDLGPRVEPVPATARIPDVISRGPLLSKEAVPIDNSVSVMDKVAELERQLAHARMVAEEEAKRLAEEQARQEEEAARRMAAAEEERLAIEARKRADELARQAAEAQRAADELHRRHEEEKRRAEEEAKRRAEEEEKRRRAEQERLARIEKERLEKEKRALAGQQAKIEAEAYKKAELEERKKKEEAERLANEEMKHRAAEQAKRDAAARRAESAPRAAPDQDPSVSPPPPPPQPPATPAIGQGPVPLVSEPAGVPNRAKGRQFPLKWVAAAAALLFIAAVSAALVLRGGRDTPEPNPDNGGIAIVPDKPDGRSPVVPPVTPPVTPPDVPVVQDKPPGPPQPPPKVGKYFLSLGTEPSGASEAKAVKAVLRRDGESEIKEGPQEAAPGTEWLITLTGEFDGEADVPVASALVRLPDSKPGAEDISIKIMVPESLPVIGIHNPYATADYAYVEISGPETAPSKAIELSATESEQSIKLGQWTPLDPIVREARAPFPAKGKPLQRPIAGSGVWNVTFTGSHLEDRKSEASLARPDSLKIVPAPPLSGSYTLVAEMAEMPGKIETIKENGNWKPVGNAIDVPYYHEMVYIDDDKAAYETRTLIHEKNSKIAHFLGLAMNVDLRMDGESESKDVGDFSLLLTWPHGVFIRYGGDKVIVEVRGNSIALTLRGTEAGINAYDKNTKGNPVFDKWAEGCFVNIAAGSNIYIDDFRDLVRSWANYQLKYRNHGAAVSKPDPGSDLMRLLGFEIENEFSTFMLNLGPADQNGLAISRLSQVFTVDKLWYEWGKAEGKLLPPEVSEVHSILLDESAPIPQRQMKRGGASGAR